MRKALIVGLDCAAPQLMFDRFIDRLPNFRRLMRKGAYGRLESCDPPITIPAWMVMSMSKSPGQLGLYGFRHRKGGAYEDQWIATSNRVRGKKIWDHVSDAGGESCIVAVPPSYPPYPVEGCLVGCFITPDTGREYTYPPELRDEIREFAGDYMVDVEFRVEDKRGIIEGVYEMTEKRFEVVKHLMETRDWRFFMLVEIGLDRVHHAFWRYFDEGHHLHVPDSEFEKVVEDYYVYLDEKVGELLEIVDDDTVVLVASDHGGKAMKGCFCVNTWLVEQGLLRLKKPVDSPMRLEDADVDWGNTVAWGWGGYYARVFLNLKGREEEGVVEPDEYEGVREEIAERLRRVRGQRGEEWDTKVLKPDELFPVVNGDAPDLMVYFDDLSWRSAGTMGHGTKYLLENDTGPDDAVHDKYGLYIYYDPRRDLGGRIEDMNILDVAPTVLKVMGLRVSPDMEGESFPWV